MMMAGHRSELLARADAHVGGLISRQILDEHDPRYGGFWTPDFHVEPRQSGFFLSDLITVFICPDSRWYQSGEVERAIRAVLTYMERHQRPDGCFDLTPCNYASPPDTAFMVNEMIVAWRLMEKYPTPAAAFIREPMLRLMDRAASGIAAGGFHTPNHRWAIAACLLHLEKITGRPELGARARQYLNEGLDINADGEFAERSAGNYNQVNDDQMIRLFLATGDRVFLEAAARNLEMMYCYFDPDASVFTGNSTRQDMGRKVYADTYYVLYLLVGYLLKRPELGAMAEWLYRDCARRGTCPGGLAWLLLFPEMDGYGAREDFTPPVLRYDRLFPDSQIARIREGDWSCTLLEGKANCLYFQHGSFSLYMTIYSNLCDRRNFLADRLERTETGYRMTAHAEGWYYLPFEEKPTTSDWWAMDNPHTREKIQGLPLDTTLEIVKQPDGIDLHVRTDGIDQLPFRLEFSFLPGGYVRTEHFLQAAAPGGCVTVLDGTVEAMGPGGETILLGPAFAEHNVQDRMGGAYPLSHEHYTVMFTAYTPVERVIRIRAARADRHL